MNFNKQINIPDLCSFILALAASDMNMLGLGAGLLVSLTSLSLTSLMQPIVLIISTDIILPFSLS